jgi:hypothetical protein
MLTQWHEDYKVRGKKTWVYFRETWNPTLLIITVKEFRSTSHARLSFPHHEDIKEGESPLGPKVGYKCNMTP